MHAQCKSSFKLRTKVRLGLGALILFLLITFYSYFDDPQSRENENRRALAEDCETAIDIFTCKQMRQGAIALHIIGMFYMFLAISIACDEYFVPALEVIVSRLHIHPEIAGATFMAAGGSAPELFTSFFGTMMGSDVGFGTIVGSAVFNVLFVIGMCAIFSAEPLLLTWWPFARDSIYYVLGLIMLSLFFGVITEGQIYWWEAGILLLMYFGYCAIMVYNHRLRNYFNGVVEKRKAKKDEKNAIKIRESVINPKKKRCKHREWIELKCTVSGINRITSKVHKFKIITDYSNYVHSLIKEIRFTDATKLQCRIKEDFPGYEDSWMDTKVVDISLMVLMPGHTDHILQQLQPKVIPTEENFGFWIQILQLQDNSRAKIQSIQLQTQKSNGLTVQHSSKAFRIGLIDALTCGNFSDFMEFSIINLINGDVKQTFEYFDSDKSGFIDRKEFASVLHYLVGGKLSEDDVELGFQEIDVDGNGTIDIAEFQSWYLQHCKVTAHAATKSLNKMLGYFKDVCSEKEDIEAINEDEFKYLCEKLHIEPECTEGVRQEMITGLAKYPCWTEYSNWCKSNIRIEKPDRGHSVCSWVIWMILFPICLFMWPLPIVGEEESEEEDDSSVSRQPYVTETSHKTENQRSSIRVKRGSILGKAIARKSKRASILIGSFEMRQDNISQSDEVSEQDMQADCRFSVRVSGTTKNNENLADEGCWKRNNYVITFIGSIIYIGIYSYIMLDLAIKVGKTFNIPDAVMGLTVLAAGTSTPDLITSVLVARQGQGDMAVSSSIGSNIFDILVGLPLPWFIFALIRQQPITVTASSLTVSILLLISMLLLVLFTIVSSGWVMTKSLGYWMFFFYFVFVIQDLVRNPDLF